MLNSANKFSTNQAARTGVCYYICMSYSGLFILFLASVAWVLLFTLIKGAYMNQCADKHNSIEEKIFTCFSEPPSL